MKKIYIAFAFIAVSALTVSCNRQEGFGGDELSKTSISFVLGGQQTKSVDAPEQELRTNIIPLGEHDGQRFWLEETVVSLNDYQGAPETKGTPAYTENVADLYGAFTAVAYDFSKSTYATNSPDLAAASFAWQSGKRWVHTYTGDNEPWVANKLQFFMRMPSDMSGVSNLAYTKTTIKFDFNASSLTTAEDQEDLLFATRVVDKSSYSPSAGAQVLFYHALTGVKFALGNTDTGDDTMITKVQFKGLASKGHCTITPAYGPDAHAWDGDPESNAGVTDNTKSYSCVNWTYDTGTYNPYQEFDEIADFSNSQYDFPSSFTGSGAAGTDANNLNDDDASKTFWFIPQQMDESVKLVVTYTYKGEEFEQTIDFGDGTKKGSTYPTWEAGEIRTYTIKATAVDVSITDTVSGKTKSNIVMTNTGNCDAYFRAIIIANWCDADGDIVAPWTGSITTGSGWVYNTKDGYYYYTSAVEPGDTPDAALFSSYTYTDAQKPTYGVETDKTADHLEMDIAVQALKKGTYTSYSAAWAGEAGVTF